MNDNQSRRLTIARSMAEAIQQEMRRDPMVFLMGEDIGALGGVFGNTRGLLEEFGRDRVRDTPISETAFIGAGVGAAQDGMRPIVELMFVDFFGVCFDAIYNNTLSISKAKTELREAVEIAKKGNAEEIAKSFKSIKGRMLNTFTEMAIEISDFKDIAEDVGFRGIDDVMQLGIGGMKGFARLSGNLEDSVEFLQVSYSYVGNLLTLKASDVLSDVESLVADNPMIQIKKPKTNVKETEEEDELDTKLLAEAKLMFSTMERLVDDIDGYTFKIPNSDDIVVDLDDGKLIQFK